MTALLTGISVALGALVVLLVALLVVRRRELAGALERAEEEGRRSRIFGELAGSLDLDEVVSRALEAAGALQGADAALVLLPDAESGKPFVAATGLSAEETERLATTGPTPMPEVEAHETANGVMYTRLTVPLPGEADTLGYLSVFTRSQAHEFGEDEIRELEALAGAAGPAIENARRFREARQLADLDALTGLHNRRFFHETLARECARAHRYERKLALIVFDLDNFKVVNDRVGHLAGDAALAEAAERVREVVRTADIACRVGGDEFAVILPESSLQDAEQLYRRILHAVSSRPLGPAGKVSLSAGVAELRPEDDPVAFFTRADAALYRAKESGKSRVASNGST